MAKKKNTEPVPVDAQPAPYLPTEARYSGYAALRNAQGYSSKGQIQAAAQGHADAFVEAATGSPIEAYLFARRVGEYATAYAEAIAPAALTERQTYPGKTEVLFGAKVEVAEVGVKYDYSADPVWARLNTAVERATEARREREKVLQATSTPRPEVDPETGEMFTAHPPVRTGKTSLKVTL